MVKKLGMIAGGSGIAPCLQILREIHQNRSIDKTEVTLLYGSPSLKEMVYMEEIEKIAHSDPLKSIKTHYFVGKLPENSKECPKGVSVGFITKEIMEKLLPKPTDNCLNLICGVCIYIFLFFHFIVSKNHSPKQQIATRIGKNVPKFI